ncbi:PepSY-associated TM helix domain-containing protein [Pseudoroseomonas globiformis]|uniref:PepSY-associated TM helix domain-containing protein n=1 Tax=Teichococcus globiformis TaxID=2307229 RepID=A0ABV7FTX5_9PROT
MSPPHTATAAELKAFVTRLHFYVGLFVGPFLLVAAVTGVLYVITPQLEEVVYRGALTAEATGPAQSLAAQTEAARTAAGADARLFAVRPATAPGRTTRVMFSDPSLGESESRAIFVDPVTLAVRGDLTVYGTSGILPFRTTLDYLHRNLLLGDFGRLYSELAASWLWVAALGGILLWLWRRTGRLSQQNPRNARLRTRRLHGLLGVTLSLGLLFLSVTGLTWSQWAGGRIDGLRSALGWVTPSVSAALTPGPVVPVGDHADHHQHHGNGAAIPVDAASRLDEVLAVSRAAGIDSPLVEIRLPRADRAWLVREYDRSWPTQVDTVAIDPASMQVTSRADFTSFPLVAKLIRWGIDIHMGVLFGVANQILMAAVGLGLVAATLYGYRIWWQNRPAPGALPRTLMQSWLQLRAPARAIVALVAAGFAWALPVAGASLVAFLIVDVLRWRMARPSPRPLPAE